MVMDDITVMLDAVRPLHTLYIFICLQNRNDGAHMFDVINLEIQLEAEKIRAPIRQMDVGNVAALLADHRGKRGQ